MLQNNTDPTGRFCKDIRNARIQEGQPALAARLSAIDHDDRCVGARDVMSFVDPVSLLERLGGAPREMIDGLSEPLFGEFSGRV